MNIKTMMSGVAAAFCLAALADADYDEKLEYIETDGTQWADTGLKLHFRNSMYRLNVRVLDYATTSETLFGGMTDEKDSAWASYKCFGVGAKPTGNKTAEKSLVQWCEGSDSHSYFWPISGTYTKGSGFVLDGWRHRGWFNGNRTGYGPYEASKPDKTSANTFYLGACNNAGDGVLWAHPEEKVRVHWYRARFWNNVSNEMDLAQAELIGDFIPVKKNGEVGFFDQVTKTFHPSISGVAFSAPERITWQGADDASLTDGANWVGGYAPTSMTQVAVFPAGATNRYTVADITGFFNKIGGAKLAGEDTLLWLTNLNVAGTHNSLVPCFGKGTFRVESKLNSASQCLKVFADNGQFEGLFDIYNCYTYYCTPTALGEYGVGTGRYQANFGNIRLYQGCGRLDADLRAGQTGQFIFAPGSTFVGKLSSVANNNMNFHANGTLTTTFNCEISDPLGTRRTMYLASGYYYFGDASKPKDFGKMQLQMAATTTLNAPLTFSRQAGDYTIYNQCNLALNSGNTLTFGCANAINDEAFLLLEYATGVPSKPKNIVDLNGFDQCIGKLGMWSGGFDSATQWNENLVIKSATPATLTIREMFRCDANDGKGAYCGVYPGLVNGAASIVLGDAEMVSPCSSQKRMRFNCPGSDTTGSLTAEGGYIEIMPTATFSNLTALAATKTGIVKVETADVGNATNLVVKVTDATTAKIEIADGITLDADSAQMGAKWLEPGDYSSEAGEGVQKCDYLSGTGILHVRRFGGKRGFAVFVE